jgi:hypothetical protein
MSDSRLLLRRLAEKILASGGTVPLAAILEACVPLSRLRELARRFALSPKGFRIEKAPANVLATLLAELKDAAQLDDVLALLADRAPAPAASPEEGDAAESLTRAQAERDAARRDAERVAAEQERTRRELDKAAEGRARAMERESEQRRQGERLQEQFGLLRAEVERLRQRAGPAGAGSGELEDLHRQVHDLRQELLGYAETDGALRRQNAVYQSRIRELEDVVRELEELVPKGRRKRRAPEPPPPEPDKRVLIPRFTDAFYRSLQDKERKSVERAMYAILLFCSQGYSYPGLEVKQLMGQDTWSLRASLGLRVYFRQLPDSVVEFLELGNREDQNTTLRRLKERS